MPGYRTHSLGGLASAAVLFCIASSFGYYFSGKMALQCILLAWFGALFPDIDVKSKGQKLFYACVGAVVILLFLITCYKLAALLAIVCFLPLIVNHRALFHSFWFIVITTLVSTVIIGLLFPSYRFVGVFWAFFFLTGVFSHLLLDFGLKATLRRRRR